MNKITFIYNMLLIALLSVFFICIGSGVSFGEQQAFVSVSTKVEVNKLCTEKPANISITIILNDSNNKSTSGWIYGDGISTSKLVRVSANHFNLIYPDTVFHKLTPSKMLIKRSKNQYIATITDYIPKDPSLHEDTCYFDKLTIRLKPLKKVESRFNPEEAFNAELILKESRYLYFTKQEFKESLVKARQSLMFFDKNFGALSRQSLNASALVAFSLMELERFDEAISELEPYLKKNKSNKTLSELLDIFRQKKEEQDKLFKYDKKKSTIELEPIA